MSPIDLATRRRLTVRTVLTAVMLASLPMAAALSEAFGDHGMLFAASYVAPQVGRNAVQIPGGIGGIDGGLIGTLIVYGAPAAGTAAAVLAYRVILFWPLIVGGIAFAMLRRDTPRPGELTACAPRRSSERVT